MNDVIQRLLDEQGDGQAASTRRERPQTTEAPTDEREDSSDTDGRVRALVDDVAASWADDERLAARKEAARRVLAYAVEHDEAVGRSSEIVSRVQAAVPVDGQDAETWWRKNVRPVLKEAGTYSAGQHGYSVDEL